MGSPICTYEPWKHDHDIQLEPLINRDSKWRLKRHMQVKRDPHAIKIRKDQRKWFKTQLTQTEKLIGLDWRSCHKNQSYGLGSSIREKSESYKNWFLGRCLF